MRFLLKNLKYDAGFRNVWIMFQGEDDKWSETSCLFIISLVHETFKSIDFCFQLKYMVFVKYKHGCQYFKIKIYFSECCTFK